jgi:hypothetical protein
VYLVIPESQHQISHGLQNLRPVRFVGSGMLPTIELDDEMSIGAEKIHDISIDRYLSLKLQAVQSPVAQTQPQDTLGIRLIPAQSPGC